MAIRSRRPVLLMVAIVLVAVVASACGSRTARPAADPAEDVADRDVDDQTPAADDGGGGDDDQGTDASGSSDEDGTSDPAPGDDSGEESGEESGEDPPPSAASGDGEVLSPCTPAEGVEIRTVLDGTGARPAAETMEAALADQPDLQHLVESWEAEGFSTEDAHHDAYAQLVAEVLFADAQELDGYVSGVVASPIRGRLFRVAFSGDVPDGFDPSAYELESYGLVVATGAPGRDQALLEAVERAAEDAELTTADLYADEVTGTVELQVIGATAEQVTEVEEAVEDPSRVCIVEVPPQVPCDAEVIADAQDEAERQGEVIPGTPRSEEEAETIRRSHLGLSAEDSEAKAGEEQRAWRIGAEDGVARAVTSDANPGRITVAVCRSVVVDATVEWYD